MTDNLTANDGLTETDLGFLRRAIELSEESKQRGRHPFASLVVDAEGVVLSEKGNNSMPPGGRPHPACRAHRGR